MGKIVKYCNSCDEGFAAKFTFCPDCGQTLDAFEMNPVEQANSAPQEAAAAQPADLLEIPNEDVKNAAPTSETVPVEEPIIEVAPLTAEAAVPAEVVAKPKPAAKTSRAAVTSTNAFFQTKPMDADRKRVSFEAEHDAYAAQGGFYVTVIEEKNVKQRNSLLLGSLCLIMFSLMTGLVYNIFSKDLDVGAINDEMFIASLIDDVPMTVDDEQKQNKDKDAGGGGGGGREEEETTQGDLANQTKNPERAPQAVPRMENPSLILPTASTQGNKTFPQTHDRYGDPNAYNTSWANGSGTGGGQGTGSGTGQGSGRGTGAGSGSGSGYGSGIGTGNGPGTGIGDDGNPPPPAVRISSPLKIISKPRARYTDAARTANIQGSVMLRVTFLSSGQIGSISTIRGLGGGLTEEAIAAARSIRFEPAKVNGVPQTVTRPMEISFAIY